MIRHEDPTIIKLVDTTLHSAHDVGPMRYPVPLCGSG
jgi:hypothetical protein